jgi:predicted site-specific integrase-resolvase
LNTQQARDYLNITNKELWNLSKSGKIKAVKRPNGNYKFSRQALEKYKNSLSVSSESYNPFADFLKKYNLI